jgi:hypothetical protein
MGKQDDSLLPDDTSLLVPHVVHLVKDDPSDFPHHLGASIQHTSENLRRHDQTRGSRVDGHISRHQTDIREGLEEFSIFLI